MQNYDLTTEMGLFLQSSLQVPALYCTKIYQNPSVFICFDFYRLGQRQGIKEI